MSFSAFWTPNSTLSSTSWCVKHTRKTVFEPCLGVNPQPLNPPSLTTGLIICNIPTVANHTPSFKIIYNSSIVCLDTSNIFLFKCWRPQCSGTACTALNPALSKTARQHTTSEIQYSNHKTGSSYRPASGQDI